MRGRLKRLGWAIQRFRAKRLLGFTSAVAGAAVAVWLFPQWNSAPVFGVAAVFLAGLLLARPVAVLGKRLFVKTPTWRQAPGPVSFADADLGFDLAVSVVREAPREIVEKIAILGGRFGDGRFSLVLWVVAADDAGNYWTVVQEQQHHASGRTVWTSSVDGRLTIADLDESGRPNPFRAAHRLAKSQLDLPLVDITITGWGREQLPDGIRDVAVGFARTAVSAEGLRSISYPQGDFQRYAHMVKLDPTGAAKTLGWGLPSSWHGGAVYGLLETLEDVESGSWVVLERAVLSRWQQRVKFARIDRGSDQLAGRAYSAS